MSLDVLVKSASSLPNVERYGKSDPLAVLEFRGETKQTKKISDNLNPVWDQTLSWSLRVEPSPTDRIFVYVYDHEWLGKNRLLGQTEVSLSDVMESTQPYNVTLDLRQERQELTSTITLQITYNFPTAEKRREDKKKKVVVTDDLTGGEQEEELGKATDDDKGQSDSEETTVVPSSIQQKTSTRVKGLIKKTKSPRKEKLDRFSLPNKITDFQIRVHIIEARQLAGGNLNPMVKVICGDKTKRTKSVKGTNRPSFDDILYFNINERPEVFFDYTLEIKVVNSKLADIYQELIGSFKLDVGLVYDEPGHAFIHKWLLLTDPEDTSAGVRGYLKFSVNVIAPGDNPKPSASVMSPEAVDIEANLLRPSGIRLQSATLSIRIYRGDDLPRMDPGYFENVKKFLGVGTVQKELVDPYCTVKFAGHTGETEILMNRQHPNWNEQINLGIRFPSMSDRIRFRLMDYDQLNRDDVIGTCFLRLSDISLSGGDDTEGYLPTFGPCYINVYGSPREFSDLPDKYEYLNKGGMEGVAYRGRVMIEVNMETGKLPNKKKEKIKIVDIRSLEKFFLKKKTYKLFAAFFSATMIRPADSPVEFELSIGNYGNKLDENIPSQISTTSPANPIFDGIAYYYLPWLEYKPCIVVESHWEDVSYRIETQNIFLGIADELSQKLEKVRKLMSHEKCDVSNCLDILKSAIDNVIAHVKILVDDKCLREVPKTGYNDLDRLKYNARIDELKLMPKNAQELLYDSTGQIKTDLYVNQVLDLAENFHSTLLNLAIEPQNSVPDVFIWMLSGNKRVAYHRIPSHELMFSETPMYCGKKCGKILNIQMKPPAVEKEIDLEGTDPAGALLRVFLWLGLEEHQSNWAKSAAVKEVAVFAERYENQAFFLGKWGTDGLMRPQFSDASGKISLPESAFDPLPDGWIWADDHWKVNPELSITYQPDKGRNVWEEEVYEYQSRNPFSKWPSDSSWRDVHGDELTDAKSEKKLTYKDIEPPPGWAWEDDKGWDIDKQRAVDDNGWEYCFGHGLGSWNPSERANHHTRRRRWIRTRIRVDDSDTLTVEQRDPEGWEYARFHNSTYHSTDHRMYLARRCHFTRKMKALDSSKPPIFYFTDKKKKKKKKKDDSELEDVPKQQVPRMFVPLEERHYYQLRAYFYQARELYAGDKTGFSDPYCVISFGRYSQKTLVKLQTLTPVWNETCLFENVEIFGDKSILKESPPLVVIELYDQDVVGRDFLGIIECVPTLRFVPETESKTLDERPSLKWYEIKRYGQYAGELLAAFELLDKESARDYAKPNPHPIDKKHFEIPEDIRPSIITSEIEVCCWGFRDMKRFQVLPVNSPIVEIECCNQRKRTLPLKNMKTNANFPGTVLSMTAELHMYAPPFTIRVYDKRTFGQIPLVGSHTIKTLEDFEQLPPETKKIQPLEPPTTVEQQEPQQTALDIVTDQIFVDPDAKDLKYDWWSKYQASIPSEKQNSDYEEDGYDKLEVYEEELEESFDSFFDLVRTFPLYRGKGMRDASDPEDKVIGKFKGAIKVYPNGKASFKTKIQPKIPSNEPIKVVVRVYIIKGIKLMSHDPNGKSDPYIKIKLGKKKYGDSKNHLSNTLDPKFGQMYEIPATFPFDHTLTIEVKDYDRGTTDDLIGKTSIDLENRYLTQHRARCGIPKTYFKAGPNMWRDDQLPCDILDWYCDRHGIERPVFEGSERVRFNGRTYTLNEFEKDMTKKKRENKYLGSAKQRLALHILNHKVEKILVPEHIEKRTLYNPAHPGISQGSLHMWVDIFPKSTSLPPPVDITPREPEPYVLRVVVYNTVDILLDETSVVTGEDMSDIYVKGWLQGQNETQKTDVHYRSMDGEGNFNWRFVFPFDYKPTEQKMTIRKKESIFSLDKTEQEITPHLTIQVWDNDIITPDDYIGTLEFPLIAVPRAAKTHMESSLEQLPEQGHEVELDDLFDKKRVKGWWPIYKLEQNNERTPMGKIELEMEILTLEQEEQFPAGKGRDEPNMNPYLPKPIRPETSFLWLTSPYKSFKFIIWRYYKWHIIIGILLIFAVLLVIVFVYSAPDFLAKYLLDRLLPF